MCSWLGLNPRGARATTQVASKLWFVALKHYGHGVASRTLTVLASMWLPKTTVGTWLQNYMPASSSRKSGHQKYTKRILC